MLGGGAALVEEFQQLRRQDVADRLQGSLYVMGKWCAGQCDEGRNITHGCLGAHVREVRASHERMHDAFQPIKCVLKTPHCLLWLHGLPEELVPRRSRAGSNLLPSG